MQRGHNFSFMDRNIELLKVSPLDKCASPSSKSGNQVESSACNFENSPPNAGSLATPNQFNIERICAEDSSGLGVRCLTRRPLLPKEGFLDDTEEVDWCTLTDRK